MKKWRPITGVILVLVLGILIGSAGTKFYLKHRYHYLPDRQARTAHLLEHLSKELALSDTQKAATGQILEDMAEKLRRHFAQVRPEAERIVQESFSEIRKQLDEDQQKKFDVLSEKYRQRRHRGER
ncbi:MAG: hypothetical protein ABSE25_05810 [Syntrophorhabdales bacterium]|jgi:uncharacterized membrane protein